MPTLTEIMQAYLTEHGFDGLCSDNCGCACGLLLLCEKPPENCVPAYRVCYPHCPGNDRDFNCDGWHELGCECFMEKRHDAQEPIVVELDEEEETDASHQ